MLCARRLLKGVSPPLSKSVRTMCTSLRGGTRRLGAFPYPLSLVPSLVHTHYMAPIERGFSTNHKAYMKIEFGQSCCGDT